jgi:hypothetical protein
MSSYKPYRHRRRNIYSKRRSPVASALKIAGFALGAAVIVFLGYSLQPVLQNLASGKYSVSSQAKASSKAPVSSKASAASSKTSSSAASTQIKGIYLPQSALKDTASASKTAQEAKKAGVNTAVVELKGENGVVAYASKVTQAQGQGIIASGAPDASALAQELTKDGVTPAAKISCFKDPVAPSVLRSAAVLYSGDHSQLWLEYNGDSRLNWLNPYSEDARQYIISLAKEAVSLGYKQIYLDNIEFPVSDEHAYYGDNLTTKEEALKAFMTEAQQQISAAGGKVSFIMPGDAAVGSGTAQKGLDQSLYAFTSDYYTPNLCPSLFKQGITINGTAIAKPDLAPGSTVAAAAAYLASQAGAKLSATVPYIEAYTNTSLGEGSYTNYTATEINAEIASLKNAGITSYILYSPTGVYDFSGVSLK